MRKIVANPNFPPPLRRGIKGVGNSNKHSLQNFIVILSETKCSEVSKPRESNKITESMIEKRIDK